MAISLNFFILALIPENSEVRVSGGKYSRQVLLFIHKMLVMKSPLLVLLTLFAISAQAQVELGVHYFVSAPHCALGQNIQPVHNFEISGYTRLKAADRRFYVGGEVSFGEYAHRSQETTFISEDGSATTTMVDFSSNVRNYHAVAGYHFTRSTAVVPYVTVKAGVSNFNTKIYIEDPDDHHSCHPLEARNLFSDVAFSGGAGAGVKIDASHIFKNWSKGRTWFDFSANYLYGSSIDYVNVKYMTPGEPGPNRQTKEVSVPFIDITTQYIHEHQVAQVYTSTINFLDFKIGIVKTFGGCR